MKTIFALMLVAASASAQFNFTDLALTPNEVAGAPPPPPCTTYFIANVTGMSAYETVDAQDGGYYEGSGGGNFYRYVAYAYRTVGGVKIYSATGFEQSFFDDGNFDNFYITLSWLGVANADGYRIQVMDDYEYGVSNGFPASYFDVEGALSVTIGYVDPVGFVSLPVNDFYVNATVILGPKTVCQ